MTDYSVEHDVNHPYWSGSIFNNYPLFADFWRGKPVENQPLIDPRRAGFRPYTQYPVLTYNPDFMPSCMVSQQSCDLIRPVNRCYVESPQEWLADIFRGR